MNMPTDASDETLSRLREVVHRPPATDQHAERERVYRRAAALDVFEPRGGSRRCS